MVQWQWTTFSALSNNELHEMLRLRQQVFIIEQNCIYEDIDTLDSQAWHLIGWELNDLAIKKMVAYLRVIPPGVKYSEISIGRVLVTIDARKTGLGTALMAQAMNQIKETYPNTDIRLSAQSHLAGFYSPHGFEQTSEPYDEDGIMHIDMLRHEGDSE